MSEFEDDIDDQLLELAGATEKKKKRRQHSNGSAGGSAGVSGGSASKKRKSDKMDVESDREPVESEDEFEDPYPLEGKYRDETDKRELLSMTEIRREQILEERADEKQRIQNARQIADMVRQQRTGAAGGAEDNVPRAAKRQHTARGVTKEKAHKLDELKAKRKAKDDRKRSHVDGSPLQQRDRSSSPQDMDISDSESEPGQITKEQQEEERLLSLGGGYDSHKKIKEVETPCTLADLESCRVTRGLIARHFVKPWFEDFVKGAWVRYLIGGSSNTPVYRLCEISNLAADLVTPYKVDDKVVNQAFELKHGAVTKVFNMDKVSNAHFLEGEFERLEKTYAHDKVSLPSKQALERKASQMRKLLDQPMTESDITAMLARRGKLQALTAQAGVLTTLERTRLIQERTLALRREDDAEVASIDAKLQADETLRQGNSLSRDASPAPKTASELLAKVNERNRKANMEAVRRAEIAESERKRKERKLAAMGGGRDTPPIDPSARLKTVPRTFNAATAPGTPGGGSKTGSPAPPSKSATTAAPTPVKPAGSFEDSLINSVDVDLGDF